MPDQFADALERFDIHFVDFDTMDSLINRMGSILGYLPTDLQIDIAAQKFNLERQIAQDLGMSAQRFLRAGRTVTVLRNSIGQFLTQEQRYVDPQGRTRILGQGNISGFLRSYGP